MTAARGVALMAGFEHGAILRVKAKLSSVVGDPRIARGVQPGSHGGGTDLRYPCSGHRRPFRIDDFAKVFDLRR